MTSSSSRILVGEEDQERRPSSPMSPPREYEEEKQNLSPSLPSFPPQEDEEEEEEKRRPSSPSFPPFPPQEDDTPPHSHRRRWSTPIESSSSGGVGRSENPDRRRGSSSSSSGVTLPEFFSCSSENSNSFYLEGKISPWGPSGVPPLLRETRSNAPSPPKRVTTTSKKRDLPPYLTTLDCNGRPRFHHRRVRSEGRLEIASVAVDLPEFVSVRGSEGLRIGTVRNSQQSEEDDDQEQNH